MFRRTHIRNRSWSFRRLPNQPYARLVVSDVGPIVAHLQASRQLFRRPRRRKPQTLRGHCYSATPWTTSLSSTRTQPQRIIRTRTKHRGKDRAAPDTLSRRERINRRHTSTTRFGGGARPCDLQGARRLARQARQPLQRRGWSFQSPSLTYGVFPRARRQ